MGDTGTRGRAVAARARSLVARVEEWGSSKSLLFIGVTGFLSGVVARSLILLLGIARSLSSHGHGLVHVVLGAATGYGLLQRSQRASALRLAVFFVSYETGEWPLGDPPFQELHGFLVGVVAGLLVGAAYRLYSLVRRRARRFRSA